MPIDKYYALKKWQFLILDRFNDIKYLLPYIEDDIAYYLEYYYRIEDENNTRNSVFAQPTLKPYIENIKKYLLNTIPNTFIELKTYINPMTGEIFYKYNNQLVNKTELQNQKIREYLTDIDFHNTLKLLYYNKADKYIRKCKLKKLNENLK